MEHRAFGKQPWQPAIFGMGCMRVPQHKAKGQTLVHKDEATAMVHYAIEHGVNYFDTAPVYGNGANEAWLGEALSGGWREKIHLVSKMPIWLCETEEDIDRIFEESCARLKTDYLDLYLLHSLTREYWEKCKEFHALEHLIALQKAGRIGGIGFSFHDSYELFCEIIDSYDWDMCQIQMNILDVDRQATLKGLEYAGARNIPVVIMEPLQGGNLSVTPPYIQTIYDSFPEKVSGVEWAFRFLYDRPEIKCILSGVSTMEQLQDNLRIFEKAKAHSMTPAQQALLAQVREQTNARVAVHCTGCSYCQPCPMGVDIPSIFFRYNGGTVMDAWEKSKDRYAGLVKSGAGQPSCVACGRCESHCPQHLPIIEKLREAHTALSAN